jgi:adenylate kinase family enzyme
MSAYNSKYYQGMPIGRRIHVIGNSCSGKSTLGAQLAIALSIPFVELDALNWEPGWVGLNETNPEELERRIKKATYGDEWVVAGSYTRFSQRVFWPRLETVVWLDLPIHILIWRMLIRSWVRWRSKELLWGTNYEAFWSQLKVWNKEDSLLWWIITQHRRKRRNMLTFTAESRWQHIRFVRLRSSSEIEAFNIQFHQKPDVTESADHSILESSLPRKY